MMEGSLFCFDLFCSHEIHRTRMLQIVLLVSLESSGWGRVHGLGSMTFGLVVQKFLNIEWFLNWDASDRVLDVFGKLWMRRGAWALVPWLLDLWCKSFWILYINSTGVSVCLSGQCLKFFPETARNFFFYFFYKNLWVLFSWSIVAVGDRIHRQHSYLIHRHHLAGLCPRKKIQRLKRLCRSSAIRVVIMEKLWYLQEFCN